jgi:hypothetical protein
MPISAKDNVSGGRGRSNGEWAAIVLGLAIGLLLGCAVFLRGSASASKLTNGAAASAGSSAPAAPRPAARGASDKGQAPPAREGEPANHAAETALAEELSALPDAIDDELAPTAGTAGTLATDGEKRNGADPRGTGTNGPGIRAAAAGGNAADRTARPAASALADRPSARTPDARPAKSVSGPATLAYWNGLNEIIARETSMRAAPAELTAANVGGFVDARIKAARFASSAIRDLDGAAVDPDALALGKELDAWYRDEIANNERAKSLLGASDSTRKGAGGKSWRASEERHNRQCADINRHGSDLRARLTRKYSLAFPPLN